MSKKKKKRRLDVYLYENDFFPSRERARSAIMAGLVFVNDRRVDKPGFQIDVDSKVVVRGTDLPYVSRGGLKLAKALEVFAIDLRDKVVLDVGASTGGFTDCALQNGARLVYAVDVGYGQLDWKLRNDPRVVVLERTNIRYLSADELIDPPDFATVDVSFISLSKVLGQVKNLTAPDSQGLALIKPQFEAGRDKVGKKGVVRDPNIHKEVVKAVMNSASGYGFEVLGLTYSPVKGPEGNIEYLMHFASVGGEGAVLPGDAVGKIIEEAHKNLK